MESTCQLCNKVFPHKDRFYLTHQGQEIQLCSANCLKTWRQQHPPIVEKSSNAPMPKMCCGGVC